MQGSEPAYTYSAQGYARKIRKHRHPTQRTQSKALVYFSTHLCARLNWPKRKDVSGVCICVAFVASLRAMRWMETKLHCCIVAYA